LTHSCKNAFAHYQAKSTISPLEKIFLKPFCGYLLKFCCGYLLKFCCGYLQTTQEIKEPLILNSNYSRINFAA